MVEDEEQVLNTNCRMLRRRGYDVRTAQTAAEACHQLEEQLPDLLILDIMLPDGNGLEAGYIDPKDKAVVINPEIWKDKKGKYANGVLLGRVSYITNGDFTDENISKGAQFYPIAIWFDENFLSNKTII